MATISSLGVGSGLDLTGLLDQLKSAERQKLSPITSQQKVIASKISAFGRLQGGLTSLQSAFDKLSTAATYEGRTSSISGSGVGVAVTAEAATGSYQVQVTQLAKAHVLATGGVADKTEALGGGTLKITIGNVALPDIVISASNNSLEGIRDAINAQNGGVTASIVNDGTAPDPDTGAGPYRLVLTSKATGDAAMVDMEVTGGSGRLNELLNSEDVANPDGYKTTVAPKNAELTVNGISITSQSNTVEGALQGVTLTLSAVGDEQTLTVGKDTESIRSAINSFVSAYNTLVDTTSSLTSYDAKIGEAGTLLGDPTLRSVQTRLRQGLTDSVDSDTYQVLSDLGISLQLDGTLKVDDEELGKALDGDLSAISAFFVGDDSNKGLAVKMKASLDQILDDEGTINTAIEGLKSRDEALDKSYARIESSIESTIKHYRAQFSALDSLIAQMNSTSTYLTQQFNALGAIKS